MNAHGTILASRTPVRDYTGPHPKVPCTRCGHERQLNTTKRSGDGLCRDCRLVDPHVWDKGQP